MALKLESRAQKYATGTSAQVFGSNNPRNESGVIDPTWDCLVDGVDIGSTEPFRFKQNNWLFCDWKDGTPGEHTLTVRANSQGQTFWVDWMEYTPSPKAEVPTGSVVAINHKDAIVKLSPGWGGLGSTADFTTTRGATVEIEFVGAFLLITQ